MNDKPQFEELMTVAEVADLFQVSGPTVRRWIHRHDLQAIRTPGAAHGRIRVRRRDVEAILTPEAS